ncbi:MAG: GNAT family N-acetyltransferase [Candidatus Bipolaricaulota bacterium]|nr:GNAT family N-acetyltransferase [Candidatus Bipolaricaulota bacterium]
MGSVVVQPQGLERRKWYINVVAPHPDYRRKGIARRLMEAAIEHIRQRGGELALLNVRADNVPAYLLYRRLGFIEFDSVTQLRLKAMPLFVEVEHRSPNQVSGVQETFKKIAETQSVAAEAALTSNYTIRRMGLGEWQARYELAKEAISPEAQAFNPPSEREFRISLWMRALSPFFSLLQRVRVIGGQSSMKEERYGFVEISTFHQMGLKLK